MTDEELARALCRAHVEGVAGWGEGAWLAVARRARELLSAPALPPEPAPGFVRVRAVVWLDHDGGWQMRGGSHWTQKDWGYSNRGCQTLGYVTADVPLPPAPAEIVGSVE